MTDERPGDETVNRDVPARSPVLERADSGRIERMLAALAQITAGSGDGITRLAYSPEERRAHELVASWWRDLGASVSVDAAGNTIGEIAGRAPLPALAMGSHLDTVVNGGAFDGAAGVVAATEAMRILAARPLAHPVRGVAFAGEEAARFGRSCLGSALVTGLLPPADLDLLCDERSCSLADAMRAVGLDPNALERARWQSEEWSAFIELHVEQGGELERAGVTIGIVDVVSGSIRMEMEITGVAAHSGATPMHERRDALSAAAEVILLAEQIGVSAPGGQTRATVGSIAALPGGITTIPGFVRLLIDLRDVDAARQSEAATRLTQAASEICTRRGVTCTTRVVGHAPPVALSATVRDALTDASRRCKVPSTILSSGGGHDAQIVSRLVASGLLFVPSRRGLSHTPAESSSPGDIALGTDACVHALVALDEGP